MIKQIIKNYAHDYRDMNLNEESLKVMLENFVDEVNQLDIDDHNRGEADQIEREEGYASAKEYQEINDLSDEEMKDLSDDSAKDEMVLDDDLPDFMANKEAQND